MMPTPAQREELKRLLVSDRSIRNVDGRSLATLLKNGWVETFRGDTYATHDRVGITAKGVEALMGGEQTK